MKNRPADLTGRAVLVLNVPNVETSSFGVV
jgi:hypothetical protein